MMKKLLTVLLLSTATFVATASHPVESLLERIAQGASQRISVREVPSDEDFFEISADNGRPLVTGNSAVNIAAGVNWYLKSAYPSCVEQYEGRTARSASLAGKSGTAQH